jgi:ketosteroid isomerase-like protein
MPVVPDEDIEVIRRAWAAASRSDEAEFIAYLHPDIVAVPFGATMEGETYRGPDEILGWWRNEILVTWQRFEVYPEEFERVGNRLLVTGRWKAEGIESGVELEFPATWVLELRDGKIVYWHTYTDKEQARSDVGLEP